MTLTVPPSRIGDEEESKLAHDGSMESRGSGCTSFILPWTAFNIPDSFCRKFFAVGGRVLISLVATVTVWLNSGGTSTVAICFQLIDLPHP